MKKTLLAILIGFFSFIALAAPALAATSISFAPVDVSVRQAQSFTLTIRVDPQGIKSYTTKTELHYPADLLEVKAFTFANGWTALPQPGYDLIDNTNGVLIKTGGYPGGVSSPVTFGTVLFVAKKSGNGIITLNSGSSLALDANNQNVLIGASVETAVAISAPVAPIQTTPAAPATIPKEKKPIIPEQPTAPVPTQEKLQPTVLDQKRPIVQKQPTSPQPIAPQSMLAAIGSIITFGTDSVIIGLLVTLAILGLVGYPIYAVISRARGNK